MCPFCHHEPADVSISFDAPFIGSFTVRIGRRCAATGAHLARTLFGGTP